MGKASSAKKVARAARTGGGRTRRGRTSWVWPALMAAVVVLGTAGIVYSRDQRQPDNTRPFAAAAGRPADHWHTAIGFNVCGVFVPDLPEGEDPIGIASHGDNVAHVHPFGASGAGKRAVLGAFFDSAGVDVSADRIELPGQDTKRNGDRCENGPGTLKTKVWDTRAPDDAGRIVAGDPSSIRLKDGQLITVAFLPEGTEIPKPPSETNLDRLTDVEPPKTSSPTSTSVDPNAAATSTTVANDPGATTTTAGAPTTTSPSPTTSTSRP